MTKPVSGEMEDELNLSLKSPIDYEGGTLLAVEPETEPPKAGR